MSIEENQAKQTEYATCPAYDVDNWLFTYLHLRKEREFYSEHLEFHIEQGKRILDNSIEGLVALLENKAKSFDTQGNNEKAKEYRDAIAELKKEFSQ